MTKTRSRADLGKLKDYAKLLFIKDKLTQKEIAQKTEVSEQTIGKWAVDGGWVKQQKNFVLTRQEQMGHLLDELVEINNSIREKDEGKRFADSKLGDVRRKLIKDIKELETKSSKPEAVSACIALMDFIRKVDLKVAQELGKYIDGFVKSIL